MPFRMPIRHIVSNLLKSRTLIFAERQHSLNVPSEWIDGAETRRILCSAISISGHLNLTAR